MSNYVFDVALMHVYEWEYSHIQPLLRAVW